MKPTSNQSIADQISDLRDHKAGAIHALIDAHANTLFSAALGLGFSESDAEELTQDTFVSFLEALDRFEGRSQIRTFLFGILHNKASNMRKQQKRETADDEIEAIFEQRFDARGMWMTPPQGPAEEASSQELREWIERCSEGLSEDQRSAFYLKTVEGEETDTICNVMRVSATHLGVLLYRARLKLRECLEHKWGTPE